MEGFNLIKLYLLLLFKFASNFSIAISLQLEEGDNFSSFNNYLLIPFNK